MAHLMCMRSTHMAHGTFTVYEEHTHGTWNIYCVPYAAVCHMPVQTETLTLNTQINVK
jgi:hypothetical protein